MRCRVLPAAAVVTCSFLIALFFGAVATGHAADDGARGKDIFEKRCTGCHSLDGQKNGPRLRDVYGRAAASVASFPYSTSLRKAAITWDSVTLDKWLTDPDAFVPDNDMAFRVASPEERAAIIDYLKALAGK